MGGDGDGGVNGSRTDVQVPDRADARARLLGATLAALEPASADWLLDALDRADDARAADLAFGLAARRTGGAPLGAHPGDGDVPGWYPARLRLDEAARVLIASARAAHDPGAIDALLRHADVDEQCALYRGLWLYPEGTRLDEAVGRGLRTHVVPVFEAIAHANPWPATHLDEHRWNHLVLKALFVEVALHPVHGLDARANPELARMLLDFAAERRAAGRPVPGELWRCVRPFLEAANEPSAADPAGDAATGTMRPGPPG